ncbi:MAG: MBL fold metallo-hydrolase [Lachnospiraceae bacterium]
MNLTTIVKLEDNLWAINEMDQTTMYLINGASKALLIDTGFGLTDLKKTIRSLCGDKPVIVINTHAHGDHNSGNYQFPCVYAGRFDEVYCQRPMGEEERALFIRMYFQDSIAGGYPMDQWTPGPSKETRTVKDGDLFELGDYCFEVLEIPSHTLGSVALWEESKGWMFTGDVVLTWEAWGHLTCGLLAPSASLVNYYQSLDRLSQFKERIRCIFPSHGHAGEQPAGCSRYRLPAEVLTVYRDGIKSILDGKAETEDYTGLVEDGKKADFSIGGIVFQETRMR